MRFGENNVLGPKYMHIYQFWGFAGWITWSNLQFFFIIHKNGKSTRAQPILKSSTSFRFKTYSNTPNSRHLFNKTC